jgi:hypothetical protein
MTQSLLIIWFFLCTQSIMTTPSEGWTHPFLESTGKCMVGGGVVPLLLPYCGQMTWGRRWEEETRTKTQRIICSLQVAEIITTTTTTDMSIMEVASSWNGHFSEASPALDGHFSEAHFDVGRTVNISLMALLLLSSIKMLSQQPIMVIFLFQFISCTTHIHAYMYLLLTLVSYVWKKLF